ncbi:TPA_asm: L [Howea betacytorhabdovirus 1]|nr:TPA_asm: L [Howea betacytorhabdovirus 1]
MESIIEDLGITPLAGLGDFHLRSAITPIDDHDLNKGIGSKHEVRSYHRLKLANGELKVAQPAKVLAIMFLEWIPQTEDCNEMTLTMILQQILKADARVEEAEIRSTSPLMSIAQTIKENGLGYNRMRTWMHFLNLLIIASNSMTSGRGVHPSIMALGRISNHCISINSPNGIRFTLGGDLLSVLHEGIHWIVKLDVLRMMSDKVTERYNVLTASQFGVEMYPSVYISPNKLMSFWLKTDILLKRFGNKCYKLFKLHESICWGLLQASEEDTITDNGLFLRSMIDSAKEDFPTEDVDSYVYEILKCCHSSHHYAQMAGLFRLWGHPEVNLLEGMNQVKMIGRREKRINTVYPEIMGWKGHELFFIRYYTEIFVYPPHEVLEAMAPENDYLISCLRTCTRINVKDPAYSLSSWEFIDLKETFPPPDSFNLSLIIADTAISPTRSEIKRSQVGAELLNPYVRRGVLKFIKDGVIDCKELLSGIENNPEGLQKDYKVIGLYPKEREINPKARMFSLMTLLLRAYIVVTEDMLSSVLKYFPGITMTEDLLSLSKKILSYTQEQKSRQLGKATFVMNVDFEKWNMNMRQWATSKVFILLGKMFGLPTIFDKTYTIFKDCIVYLADGSFLPEMDDMLELACETPLSYVGHEGGFEGLRQKGWTIFTVIVISYICGKMGIDYKLMGQGDNQVLILTIYSRIEQKTKVRSIESKREIKAQLDEFMARFVEIFEELGLPVKLSETWVSESLFLYGKIPVYKGVTLSSSYKRLSRIFPFSNEDLMTLDNAMSAIGANAITSSACDVSPHISLIISRWQQVLCLYSFLKYHPLAGRPLLDFAESPSWKVREDSLYRVFHTTTACSKETLIKSLIFSFKSLGGTNSINLNHLIMRGFPDSVSRDLHFLMLLEQTTQDCDPEINSIANIWLNIQLSRSSSRAMLVEDPSALNLLVPPQTLSITRKLIRESIKEAPVTSEFGMWFQELLKVPSMEKREGFITELTKGDLLYPRLTHDLYAASLFGYAESIISKVDKTVTLSRITMRSTKLDVVRILVSGETRYLNYLWWRVSAPLISEVSRHSIASYFAQSIRDLGWKAKIEGVTVPFPSQLVSLRLCNPCYPHLFNSTSDYISVNISASASKFPHYILDHPGSSAPYLGSSTGEKLFSKHENAIFGTEPLLKRPVSLSRIVGWVVSPESNYSQLILKLIEAVTDTSPSRFITAQERPSGSASHRYHDSATSHGAMYNNLLSPASHINLSSEGMFRYGRGSSNVDLLYQALFCYSQSVVIRLISQGILLASPIRSIHFHLVEAHGLKPVLDNIPDLSSNSVLNYVPSLPNNPYLFVKGSSITARQVRYVSSRLSGMIILGEDLISRFSEDSLIKIAEDNLAHVIAEKVLNSKLSPSDTEQIFDIQSLNRFFLSKVRVLNVLEGLVWKIVGALFLDSLKESGDSFPYVSNLFKRARRVISSAHSQCFVDLTPIFWDKGSILFLQECQLFSVPLAYPYTPKSLIQASKQLVINFIKTYNVRSKPKLSYGILLDEFSSNPVRYIRYMMWARLYRMRGCMYCKMTAWTHPANTAGDISSFSSLTCKLGHLTGKLLKEKLSWGVSSIPFSTLIKSLPTLDIITGHPSATHKMTNDDLPYEAIWSSKSKQNWCKDQIPIDYHEFSYQGNHLMTAYDLWGKIKTPTKALVRVFEVVSLSKRLGFREWEEKLGNKLILGDGFGYSSSAVALSGITNVTSWTYINVDEAAPHSLDLAIPPGQLILGVYDKINNHPSMSLEQDITSGGWISGYSLIHEANPISIILSEIELIYTSNSFYSGKRYIDNILETQCNAIIMKTKFLSNQVLYYLLSRAASLYHTVILTRLSLGDSSICDYWVFIRNRRVKDLAIWVSRSSWEEVSERIRQFVIDGNSAVRITKRQVNNIDSLFWGHQLDRFMTEYADRWFGKVGLMSWDSNYLTNIWYELLTSKKPKSIIDHTGRDELYLFERGAIDIGNRLLALAYARVAEDCYPYAMESINDWKISWVKTKHMVGNKTFNWSVVLMRSGHKSRFRRHTSVTYDIDIDLTELLRIIPYLRSKESYTTFKTIADIVPFRYSKMMHQVSESYPDDLWNNTIVGHGWEQRNLEDYEEDFLKKTAVLDTDLCFLVSKRSSYSSTLV